MEILDSGFGVDCGTFRIRLNELFAASDRRLTNREVAEVVSSQGRPLSEVYLSQLRSGARCNPSDMVLSGLAAYFEVPQEDFFAACCFDERDRFQACSHDAALVDSLSTSNLKRILTLTIGLSGPSLRLLDAIATELEHAELELGRAIDTASQ